MDKGLTVQMIVWPKIPQMPQNLSAQIVCPSPKILDFNKEMLHWASVIRASNENFKICFRDSLTFSDELVFAQC